MTYISRGDTQQRASYFAIFLFFFFFFSCMQFTIIWSNFFIRFRFIFRFSEQDLDATTRRQKPPKVGYCI